MTSGSLQTKKGNYYVVIPYKNEEGERKTKWEPTGVKAVKGNKRKAEQRRLEILREYDARKTNITNDIPFHVFMQEWLDIVKIHVKPSTHHEYSLIVNNSIVPFFKKMNISLQDLTPAHIQKYYNKKVKDGAAAGTVRRHHANIHKALNHAVKQNLIPYNISDRTDLPKKDQFIAQFYTEKEIQDLFISVRGTLIETPIILAATYGLRRGEVVGLKWSAVDFDRKTIVINHTVTGSGKKARRANTTKNKSSYRTLPLLPYIESYLKERQRQQKEMQLFLGASYVKSDYICVRENGDLLKPDYVSCGFKKLLEKHKMRKIRFHDLRHSAASILLAHGYNLKEIGEWLGHSDPSTTNMYAHLQYKAKMDMANTVNEKLFAVSF